MDIGVVVKVGVATNLDTSSPITLEIHPHHVVLDEYTEVWVFAISEPGMQIGMGSILPFPVRAYEAKIPLDSLVRVQILKVEVLGEIDAGGGLDKLILKLRGAIGSSRYVNWTTLSMGLVGSWPVIRFVLRDPVRARQAWRKEG